MQITANYDEGTNNAGKEPNIVQKVRLPLLHELLMEDVKTRIAIKSKSKKSQPKSSLEFVFQGEHLFDGLGISFPIFGGIKVNDGTRNSCIHELNMESEQARICFLPVVLEKLRKSRRIFQKLSEEIRVIQALQILQTAHLTLFRNCDVQPKSNSIKGKDYCPVIKEIRAARVLPEYDQFADSA
jgi:hypothetical protein